MAKSTGPSFFDTYAHEYDLMTDAVAREAYHQEEVAAIIDRFQPHSVLDAGCATGLTSMLFARRGIGTVGLDRSRKMIREARRKYSHLDYPLEFRPGHFERLPKKLRERFDLVVCLANSISGTGTLPKLRLALRQFHAVLKPAGTLVLQLVNYLTVKERQFQPIKATEHNGIVFERFSSRRGKRFYIYVTRLDLNRKPPDLKAFVHEFDNFSEREVTTSVRFTGFVKVRKYSDLYLTKKFSRSSRDLVLVCSKSG